MNDGYEKMQSRESARANKRQSAFEADHSSNNAFVKSHEAMTAVMGGHAPKLEAKYMYFDAEMVSDGMHAQELGRDLTTGLDKKAFPVK